MIDYSGPWVSSTIRSSWPSVHWLYASVNDWPRWESTINVIVSINWTYQCLFYSLHTTNTLTGSLSTRFPTLIIVFKTQINSWLKTLTNSQRTFHTCILTSPNPLLIYSCSPISLVKQCKEEKYDKWMKPNLPSHSFSGSEAPFFMIGYFVLSGVVLRAFSPPFGRCMLLSSLHILHLYSKFIVLHYRHSNWAKVGRRL